MGKTERRTTLHDRQLALLALLLMAAQLVLVLASWLLSVVLPVGIRSLLSGEGVRWLFGSFARALATPLLVGLLLLSVAYGALRASGLFRLRRPLAYRERIAILLSLSLLMIYVAVLASLTLIPHAVLLSVSGTLFPSPFSASLVPVIAFGIMLVSITFGVVSGSFKTLTDVYHSLLSGIRLAAPLFFFYILLAQLYYALWFVFG